MNESNNTKSEITTITGANHSQQMKLLATKLLPNAIIKQFHDLGFQLTISSFIKIVPTKKIVPVIEKNVILTSSNASAIAFSDSIMAKKLTNKRFFCVGQKTAESLEKRNVKPIHLSPNAEQLAKFIVEHHRKKRFSFLCSNLRLPTIEQTLKQHHVHIKIAELYKTIATPTIIRSCYDGIILFSPSAANSFFSCNRTTDDSYFFCIGNSTAEAAKKFTNRTITAAAPNLDSLIQSIVSFFVAKQHNIKKLKTRS